MFICKEKEEGVAFYKIQVIDYKEKKTINGQENGKKQVRPFARQVWSVGNPGKQE